MPVKSEMISTEDIGQQKVKQLMPNLAAYGETPQLGHYFRPSPDKLRILIGGRRTNLKA